MIRELERWINGIYISANLFVSTSALPGDTSDSRNSN